MEATFTIRRGEEVKFSSLNRELIKTWKQHFSSYVVFMEPMRRCNYEIQEQIGKGSQGQVFLALKKVPNGASEKFAIKQMNKSMFFSEEVLK
jgi:serine/threonine protein kinase